MACFFHGISVEDVDDNTVVMRLFDGVGNVVGFILFKVRLEKLDFLAIVFVLLAASSQVWAPSPLIMPLPYSGFIDYTELMIPFLMILPISNGSLGEFFGNPEFD